METSSWVLLATVFWVFGYLKTKFGVPSDGRVIFVPKWLYTIGCGFPQSKELPNGAVTLVGLRAQLIGWFLLLFGLFIQRIITNSLLSFLIGFVGSFILALLLVILIDKN